ncbi:oxidoreductase [Salinivibrio sp. PR5]|uniref:oxidoreductase n=1 Tax=Salinivibrio sp. PR5 TaxID=1909484 RepID=UPI000D52E1A6|nr:oxidoreductase [Salinivibrio sp. PR5]
MTVSRTVTASPMLTITSKEGTEAFTREQLVAMADRTIETATPWTDGQQRFLGVSAQKLLAQLDIPPKTLKVYALNDYWAHITVEDIERYNPIFAIKKNGQWMRVRDKGPIWVIYPLSENDLMDNEIIHSRMVWQANRVEVMDE